MRRLLVMAVVVLVTGALGPAAVSGNRSSGHQEGSSRSGDAVGGPVVAIIHEGDLRAEITNVTGARSDVSINHAAPRGVRVANVQGPTSVASGAAQGSNKLGVFVGLVIDPQDQRTILGWF